MSITKRKDGRFVQTVKDERTGKRLYFYGATPREVRKKILEYSAKAEDGRSFSELAREWREHSFEGLAYQSLKVYKPAFERAVDEFGDRPIKSILPKDIAAFFKRLATYSKLSRKTLSNQKTVLNGIFDYALLENDIVFNPCASVPIPSYAPQGERRTAAAPEDEAKIKESAKCWLLPFIALYTGMRKGEILALQWRDIDFENDRISVTKSVYHEGDRPYVKLPKTQKGIRSVPLLSALKEELIKRRAGADDYVISDDGKTPLTNRRYQTLYKSYRETCKISCTSHQLRHSFATIAVENGVSAKSVQEILGHKQISTTLDTYTDFRDAALNEARAELESAFKK